MWMTIDILLAIIVYPGTAISNEMLDCSITILNDADKPILTYCVSYALFLYNQMLLEVYRPLAQHMPKLNLWLNYFPIYR